MSSSNIFVRIGNLVDGFFSLFVGNIEKNNPEIVYERAVNNAQTRYGELRTASAAVIRIRNEIRERLSKAQAELAKTRADLDAAVAANRPDLGAILIQREEKLAADFASIQAEAATAEANAETIKQSLLDVQASVADLKRERDQNLAKFQSSKAMLAVGEMLDGLSADADIQALSRVREHIGNTVAEQGLQQELRETDLDAQLKKLTRQAAPQAAAAKFEELRAKRAAAAQAAQRTL